MAKDQWVKTKNGKIKEHKAISLRRFMDGEKKKRDEDEHALVGKHGEIWQINDTTFGAVITSSRVAKKYLPEEHHPLIAGDETLIEFPEEDLADWMARLKVYKSRNKMIRLANWFGSDEDEQD